MYEIDSQKLVWRKLDNELVVLNLEDGSYFTMNEIGATIWEAFCAGHDNQQAIARVVRNFQVDAQTAAADTEEFINLLKAEGLLLEKNCLDKQT